MPEHSNKDSAATPQEILIQVRQIPMGGSSPQSVQGALKKITAEQLKAVGSVVGQVREWLFKELATSVKKPDSFSIEFGIDVEGEAGIPFVTKGSIGANFKVSMEWKAPG